ncbi:sulfite reductase [NADPH] flavoprotein component, partial [Coemansia thaxteri]
FSVVFVADVAIDGQRAIAYAAQAAGVPVNVAGSTELSDFSLMPTYRGSSSLQIAVTTNGVAPRVASRLLKEIVGKLPSDLESRLVDVARLNRVAHEATSQRDEALAKLCSEPGDSGIDFSVPADISSAATVAETPTSAQSSPGSVVSEYQPPAPLLALADLSASTAQLEQTTDVQIALSYIAHALSDLCFVYSAPEQELGRAVLAWSRRAERNAYGEWVSALRMETRAGAGHALWGALSSGSAVSAIASAASLPYMLPVLSELVARRQPLVVHAAAQSLSDANSAAHTDFSDILVAQQSQAVFLISSSAQEAHDVSLVAHAVSQAASVPVVHVTNGAPSADDTMLVRMAGHQVLTSYVEAVVKGASELKGDPAAAIQLAFDQFKRAFGRTYRAFEYSGSPVAETVFVSLGETATRAQTLLPKLLAECDTGVLNVRALRPWSIGGFVSSLPATTKRVIVLGATKGGDSSLGVLLSDVALSVLIGRHSTAVQVRSANVCGADQRTFDNAIREALSLGTLVAEAAADAEIATETTVA